MASDDEIIREERLKQKSSLQTKLQSAQERLDGILRRAFAFPNDAVNRMNRYQGKDKDSGKLIAALAKDPHQFGAIRANRFTGKGWEANAAAEREDAAIAGKELPDAMRGFLDTRVELRRIEKLLEPKRGFFSRPRGR